MILRLRGLRSGLITLLLFTVVQLSIAEPCNPGNRSVAIPIRIRLFYAGAPPLFMREKWDLARRREFLDTLATKIRREALPFDSEIVTPIIKRLHPHPCSVVEHDYTYEMATAKVETVKQLDAELSKRLKEADSIFVESTASADEFYQIVEADPAFRPSLKAGEYNLLIYNSISVAPQYGYRAEVGGQVTTTGIASQKRFAFIDIGARPYFLGNPGSLSPGEELTSLSGSPQSYAKKMQEIAASFFTPSTSTRMRRFPHETRLAFRLFVIDVSAAIGRKSGVAGDSLGNQPLGASFDSQQFSRILQELFRDPALSDKTVSVEVETVDMDKNGVIGMAVIRAFSMKGLQMILDSDQLFKDVVSNAKNDGNFFVDASFVVHIPMYLFSIADDSRSTHFDTGEQTRTRVKGKQAVFMVENRLRDEKDQYLTVTTEAVDEVLELLCGLSEQTLPLMNANGLSVPIIVRDIARRNIMTQELDWSATTAWKADELLNYEGLDSRLIPHEEGSVISECQKSVTNRLRKLHEAWHEAAQALSPKGVEIATLDLIDKSDKLAQKLHEEVCNQPLPEEILLQAEAELEVAREEAKNDAKDAGGSTFSDIWFVVIPGVTGIFLGTHLHAKTKNQRQRRGQLLDGLPVPSAVRKLDVSATTQWFSTLTASDKSKVH